MQLDGADICGADGLIATGFGPPLQRVDWLATIMEREWLGLNGMEPGIDDEQLLPDPTMPLWQHLHNVERRLRQRLCEAANPTISAGSNDES